jgi:hypothetical protein
MLVDMGFCPCFESSITKPPAVTEGTSTQIPEMSNRRRGTLDPPKKKESIHTV